MDVAVLQRWQQHFAFFFFFVMSRSGGAIANMAALFFKCLCSLRSVSRGLCRVLCSTFAVIGPERKLHLGERGHLLVESEGRQLVHRPLSHVARQRHRGRKRDIVVCSTQQRWRTIDGRHPSCFFFFFFVMVRDVDGTCFCCAF